MLINLTKLQFKQVKCKSPVKSNFPPKNNNITTPKRTYFSPTGDLEFDQEDNLLPVMSKKAMKFHWNHYTEGIKHLNRLVEGTIHEYKPNNTIPMLIKDSQSTERSKIFYYANDYYNHTFFFRSLKVRNISGYQGPPKHLEERFKVFFGGLEGLKRYIEQVAISLTDGGFIWLVDRKGHMEILVTTSFTTITNQESIVPLMCIDLYEHAWILDHPTKKNYLNAFWEQVNWDFILRNLTKVPMENQTVNWSEPLIENFDTKSALKDKKTRV